MQKSVKDAPHPETDIANGVRFAAQHSADVRYNADAKRWLVWDGARWHENAEVEIEAKAKQTAISIWDEAKEQRDTQPRRAAWAVRSESATGVAGMLTMAHSEPGIVIRTDALDRDLWLLNTPSGTVDLKTGEQRQARREDLITKVTAAPFDPAAECPRWLQFLGEVFTRADFSPDLDLIAYIQRLAGYTLTGSVQEQMFAMLYGTGRNGKGVFLRALQKIMGDYGTTTPTTMLLAKRNEVHPVEHAILCGRRLVGCQEIDQGRRLDESAIKNITGGDAISARWMHGNPFEFPPTHKLFLSTNYKPEVRGVDKGIWSRIHTIPFLRSFEEREQDVHLDDTLEGEWPGILAWAVRGCTAWQERGRLDPPEAVLQATASYREESDMVARWMEDSCECIPGAQREAGALYTDYKDWCKSNGEQELSGTAFGRNLAERGFSKSMDYSPTAGKTVTFRHGIRLNR